MHRAYAAARPMERQRDSLFHCFLICYPAGALAGILASRISWRSAGAVLLHLGDSLVLAGREAQLSLFRSSCFLLLLIILLSQLSGRAFWLSALICGKAFCSAYVAGILYLCRSGEFLHWALHTALTLPLYCGLTWYCWADRLSVGRRRSSRIRLLPMLLAFPAMALLLGLEALLFAWL